MKLGSLFDGSGGFPLAGSLCGIEPVWAAEGEPYPSAGTRSRFPHMKHLGDVTKINGADIEPVDIITFGSPCQDLSVAGKRAGLKHESNGDDETTRSGLFMEAIRIIKEMRGATNGVYPRFAVWENVVGAFSSNGGEDSRIVLEEFTKIVEPSASMPAPEKGRWAYADCYVGDGWSVAYRTFDAQYWGVPQRRRRIYLVADFGGECAWKILFEREGVSGYSAEGFRSRQRDSGGSSDCPGATGFDGYNGCLTDDKAATIGVNCGMSTGRNGIVLNDHGGNRIDITDDVTCTRRAEARHPPCVLESAGFCHEPSSKTRGIGYEDETSPTLRSGVVPAAVVLENHPNDSHCTNAQYKPCIEQEVQPAIVAKGPGAVAHSYGFYPQMKAEGITFTEDKSVTLVNGTNPGFQNGVLVPSYTVRRLTPTECARLQGFPDAWGVPEHKEDFTDEEYRFWLNARNTYAVINCKAVRQYTRQQMLAWYNKLHTDSAEYKMWGNGIALPCALYVMQGIQAVLNGGGAG